MQPWGGRAAIFQKSKQYQQRVQRSHYGSIMGSCCLQFEHLDGHKVKLEASEVTIPGQVFKVEKEGMPLFDHPDRTGDLYVTITVAFPRKLTQSQKDQISKQFKGLHDEL